MWFRRRKPLRNPSSTRLALRIDSRPKGGPKRNARLDHVPGESNFEAQTKEKIYISEFGVGLTTMSSMANTIASRAAAAEARHGL